MFTANWTDADTDRALEIWHQYQHEHDVKDRIGDTAGIDPGSGRIWFGRSARDIWRQMEYEGIDLPLYYIRVGNDYYVRKGIQR